MTYMVGITGKNGYKYVLPGAADLDDVIDKYKSQHVGIKCVAIGRCCRYAIVTDKGAYWACGPQTMLDKMKELHKNCQTNKIKHITFGPGDTWAITMDSGWCHARTRTDDSGGPLDVINEHNGKIKYVSMNYKEKEWIVGWGNNGWRSKGLNCVHKKLSGKLYSLSPSRIDLVEIGHNSYFIKHENGTSFAIGF